MITSTKDAVSVVFRCAVEPSRFIEVPRDSGNWFVISRFCSVHFKKPGWRISFVIPKTSLYRGSTVSQSSYELV